MTAYGLSLALCGVAAACSRGADHDHDRADTTGGASAGLTGKGGMPSSGGMANGASSGTSSGAGASSGASASGMSGASGTSSTSGASGTSSTSGASGASSTSGASGTSSTGGASGSAGVNGVAGTLSPRGGAAGRGGSAGGSGTGTSEAGESGAASEPVGLSWPIDCIPNETCVNLDYPDIDADGEAHDCSEASYVGHEGTDIGISFDAEAAGTAVRAAADGIVLFAFDGKYDQCPDDNQADCQTPPGLAAGSTTGNTVCTPLGPYCGTGEGSCFWCFAGGNVLVIRHEGVPGVFATRYDHLKKGSLRVGPGDTVARGEKIAEAASAGNSTGPHLHFEVWSTGFYELGDPWAGPCGPNTGRSLWAYEPPWLELER